MPFWRRLSPSAHPQLHSQSQLSAAVGPSSSQFVPPPPLPVHTIPAPGTHISPPTPPQTQPRTIKLSPGALASLPYRLFHPPPAKSKLSTWSITPQFDIKLDDILDRKHLPPLGLKDFEEWLLFVEHTPEYLYFVLWLREYTARYAAWKQQLKQQQQAQQSHNPLPRLHTSPSSGIPSNSRKNAQFRKQQRRKSEPPVCHHVYASTSTPGPRPVLSISTAHSPTGSFDSSCDSVQGAPESSTSSLSSFANSPTPLCPPPRTKPKSSSKFNPKLKLRYNPNSRSDSPLTLPRSSHSRTHIHNHHTSINVPPASPPSLATFYLRAKETFLTMGAAYELSVHDDVLAVFHLKSCPSGSSEELMGFNVNYNDHGCGSAYSPSLAYSPHSPLSSRSRYRNPHRHDPDRALPLPPDPEIFAELKGIVEDRLKAALGRFVVATYNNVGTPRAVCGCAGGIVIGTTSSVPILASNFAQHAPRWWRVFALPGMWLGMTIFLSAMYGVCMMIYVFGDLRQLRSFELTRPRSGAGRSYAAEKVGPQDHEKEQKKDQSQGVGVGVERVQVKPITRPPKVRLVDVERTRRVKAVAVSRPSVHEKEKEKEERDGQVVLQRPALAAFRRGRGKDGDDDGSSVSSVSSRSGARHSDSGVGTESFASSSSSADSHSDCYSDEDGEGDDDRSVSLHTTPPLPRRPRILISDAYYDEHPSPEGFATSTSPFPFNDLAVPPHGVGARRGSSTSAGVMGVGGGEGEGGEGEGRNVTASFIRGFVYDEGDEEAGRKEGGGRFRSRGTSSQGRRSSKAESTFSRSGIDDDDGFEEEEEDIEAQRQARVAEKQPMDEFDFDGLPPRLDRQGSPTSAQRYRAAYSGYSQYPQYPQYPQYLQYPQYPQYAQSPQSPQSPSAEGEKAEKEEGEDERRHSLVSVLLWMVLSWLQVKCSPSNAASHHLAHLAPATSLPHLHDPEVEVPGCDPEKDAGQCAPPSQAATKQKEKEKEKRKSMSRRSFDWRESFRRVSRVPAFASPLTPVLNPIVGRAQWEIVVRSAFISLVACGAVVGALMGVPVPK